MAKQTDEVLQVERDGPVTIATINRPHRRNALNGELTDALLAFFRAQRRDRESKVIILRGSGDHFCVGADLIDAASEGSLSDGIDQGDWSVTEVTRDMRACPQPIVALANGAVAGGGMAYALAADIILASDTAFFCTAFMDIGLSGTELGVSWRLQRTMGLSLARELIFTSGRIAAQDAANAGLVSRVVPAAELQAEGLALAQRMARYTQDALRLTKRNLDIALQSPLIEVAIELEERSQMRCVAKGDFSVALAEFNARHAKS
ncbi:MAG: enoyl-CoA hydratase/isomerase family protein [Sphingopyxis sp.]|nr:enoyl-CoA hydratase/isomerase family protein [Sphingopyxis sp.]